MPQISKKVTGYTPGSIINTQRLEGAGSGYCPQFTATSGTFLINTGGPNLQLVLTPRYDAWWQVRPWIGGIAKIDTTAYNYFYLVSNLSPADADGASQLYSIFNHHRSNIWFAERGQQALWKLNAGITYTCSAQWVHSGGSWQYLWARNLMSIEGIAWTR